MFLRTSRADVLSHTSVIHHQGPRLYRIKQTEEKLQKCLIASVLLGCAAFGEKFFRSRGSHLTNAEYATLRLGKTTSNLWIIKGLVSYRSQTASPCDVLLPRCPRNQSNLWHIRVWRVLDGLLPSVFAPAWICNLIACDHLFSSVREN